jgi:nicotinamide-nucleotide amidase
VGIAPGFFLAEEERFIAVLPGVPSEMRAMFLEGGLRQALVDHVGGKTAYRRKVLHTAGLTESKVNGLIEDLMKQNKPSVGLSATDIGVDVRILARETSKQRALTLLDRTEAEIRTRLGDAVYGVDGQGLEEVVGALLVQRKLSLSVAESCTGGLIAARITNVAGSSAYFERGVTTYSNRSKTDLLGVPAELIERHGAVSRETAGAMAQGIRDRSGAGLGLAVTGIAGPGGGSEEKPVGLVFIALATADGVTVNEHRFLGTRNQVRQRSAQTALDMVRRYLIA